MTDTPPSDDAIQELLLKHFRRQARFYRSLSFGLVRSVETAREVCQEAYLKAWAQRRTIRDWQTLDQWLTEVVVNESLLHNRRRQKEKQLLRERAHRPKVPADPCETIDDREAAIFALEQLPETLHAVVALRLIQGLKTDEVARLLGLTYGQTSQRLHRGIEQMRKCLFDHRDGGGPSEKAKTDNDSMDISPGEADCHDM